jgi:hypothetical protein
VLLLLVPLPLSQQRQEEEEDQEEGQEEEEEEVSSRFRWKPSLLLAHLPRTNLSGALCLLQEGHS